LLPRRFRGHKLLVEKLHLQDQLILVILWCMIQFLLLLAFRSDVYELYQLCNRFCFKIKLN
jgi:hypothetical protein